MSREESITKFDEFLKKAEELNHLAESINCLTDDISLCLGNREFIPYIHIFSGITHLAKHYEKELESRLVVYEDGSKNFEYSFTARGIKVMELSNHESVQALIAEELNKEDICCE